MSSFFSIGDANFDEIDDEFLVEACNFNLSQSKSDDTGASLKTTGDDNTSSRIKSSTLRGFGCANSSDVSMNSVGLLRSSPANIPSETVYSDTSGCQNGKRLEMCTLPPEPPQKRPVTSTETFSGRQPHADEERNLSGNGINRECPDNRSSYDNNNELHRKRLKSNSRNMRVPVQHMPNTSRTPTKNVDCRSSDGLRYTQNASFPVRSSPNLNKDFQLRDSLLSKKSTTTFDTPLPRKNSNTHIRTDLSPSYFEGTPSRTNNVRTNMHKDLHRSPINESPEKVIKTPPNEKCFTPKTRRFPGPAGILPRLEPGQNLNNLPSPFAETPKKKSPEICQMINNVDSDEDFSTKPWTMMQEMINKRFHTPLDSLAFIIRKATSQQLDNGKVAFLGVLVKSFNPSGLDASVVLKDPSGEMRGTLHRKVLEEHQVEPGCGLFLKQVSVFSPSPRKHYLNITPGNIVEIFPVSSKEFTAPEKASQSTPERQSSQIIREPDLNAEEQTATSSNLCEDNFDDLLQDLGADDDILIEAMCF